MPKLLATHSNPADAPTPAPKATEGRGPRKLAKFQAANSASTNDRPKIFAMFPFLSCSSVRPVSRCQALPNKTGEYQRPPNRKLAMAATKTAIQLISGMEPSQVVVVGFCASLGSPVLEKWEMEMGTFLICSKRGRASLIPTRQGPDRKLSNANTVRGAARGDQRADPRW